MQCPSCNTEISPGARFCTTCGHDLSPLYEAGSVAAPGFIPAASGQPPVQIINRAPLPFGKIMVWALGVLLLAMAGWGIRALIVPTKPDQVCAKYMEAMKSGDYGKCYGLFNEKQLEDQPFLTKSWFLKANKDAKITGYTINSSYGDKITASNLRYAVQTTSNGSGKSFSMNLINTGTLEKPRWRVDPTPMMSHCSITSIAGTKAWIDGEEVPFQDGRATINTFQGLSGMKVKWEASGAKTGEKQYDTLPGSITLTLEPDEKLQDAIKKVITGYEQASCASVKDLQVGVIAPYVKQDSPAWKEAEGVIKNLQASGMVADIAMEGLTLSQYRFRDNLNTIQVNETVTASYKMYSGATVQRQENHKSNSSTFTLEKQTDGKWLITRDD